MYSVLVASRSVDLTWRRGAASGAIWPCRGELESLGFRVSGFRV